MTRTPALPDSPDRAAATRRASVWSRYWSTGARHSCAGSFGQFYEGAIANWWQQVFETLNPSDSVLDLATGSGAVLQLALKHDQSQSLRLRGIDAGQVLPAWLDELAPQQAARVHIHAGICVESLPFADQTFELVTSQFGIEYSSLESSLAEVRRVLRPAGELRAVLHHAQSRSVRLAHVEVAHIHWLLQPKGLLETAESMCDPISRASTPAGRIALVNDVAANELRQRFNALQEVRISLIKGSTCPDVLHEASQAINSALATATNQGMQAGQAVCRRLAQELNDSEFRLAELIHHALTPSTALALQQRLESLGFVTSLAEMRHEDLLIAWALKADSHR
jgi:SAM-dependent methyltransferase